MSFEDKLHELTVDIHNKREFSQEVISFMKVAFESHKVSIREIVGFFYNINTLNENEILDRINDLIRRQYRIKFHNIGKKSKDESVYERYYQCENITEWLKLEHSLIAHSNSINKSSTFLSNKSMAIKLGYIAPDEINKDKIKRASRKVTDLLYILKEKRETIIVEQRFNYGQKGSYHHITANWDRIIELYQTYNDKAKGSIRFRKSIKYRIISLLRNVKNFGDGLKKLMNKQKNKYLKGLILYKEGEQFNEDKQVLFRWLKSFHFLERIQDKLTTDYIIPQFNGKKLTLEVKDEDVYGVLIYLDGTKTRLEGYGYKTTIKPIF